MQGKIFTMKKIVVIIVFCFLNVIAFSQTQSGNVRTIGRPDKPGEALAGVVIQAQGMVNPVISDEEGNFNISIPGKKDGDALVIMSVRKNGYELKDPEFKGRQLVCSSRVPIMILMVDKKQLEADRQRIEEKAYQVAEENYQKRLAELENRQNEHQITAERYRQELNDLENKYEQYLSLIGTMADRYARTDYDQLDSIDYQINICIENGELDKADSLIHTIFDPETVLERNHAAKQEIQERIAFAQSVIDKAAADKEAIMRDLEYAQRIAALCDNLADEYIGVGQYDKALSCLEKSLEIKTILYGENSYETILTRQKIEEIKP